MVEGAKATEKFPFDGERKRCQVSIAKKKMREKKGENKKNRGQKERARCGEDPTIPTKIQQPKDS